MIKKYFAFLMTFLCIVSGLVGQEIGESINAEQSVYAHATQENIKNYYGARDIMVKTLYFALYREGIIHADAFLDNPIEVNTIKDEIDFEQACAFLHQYFQTSGYHQAINIKYALYSKHDTFYRTAVKPITSQEELLKAIRHVAQEYLLLALLVKDSGQVNINNHTSANQCFTYTAFFMGLALLEDILGCRKSGYIPRMCIDYAHVNSPERLAQVTPLGNEIAMILDYMHQLTNQEKTILLELLRNEAMGLENIA